RRAASGWSLRGRSRRRTDPFSGQSALTLLCFCPGRVERLAALSIRGGQPLQDLRAGRQGRGRLVDPQPRTHIAIEAEKHVLEALYARLDGKLLLPGLLAILHLERHLALLHLEI